MSDKSDKSDKSGKSDNSDNSDNSDKSGKSDNSDNSCKCCNSDTPAHHYKTGPSEPITESSTGSTPSTMNEGNTHTPIGSNTCTASRSA